MTLEGIGRKNLKKEVLRYRPERVIVKVKVITFLEEEILEFLPKKKRDEEMIWKRHQAEMRARGLSSLRDRPDSGVLLVNNAREVKLLPFIQDLTKMGFRITEVFCQFHHSENKRAFVWLVFTQGDPVIMDDNVADVIERWLFKTTFGYVHVWGNLRESKGAVYRLDTVNCNAEHPRKVPLHKDRSRRSWNVLRVTPDFRYQVHSIENFR